MGDLQKSELGKSLTNIEDVKRFKRGPSQDETQTVETRLALAEQKVTDTSNKNAFQTKEKEAKKTSQNSKAVKPHKFTFKASENNEEQSM